MTISIRKVLFATLVTTVFFASATLAAGNGSSTGKAILVDPDLPVQPSQLRIQKPSFTPFVLGVSRKITTEQGNWKYNLSYRYGQQGWHLTSYEARRIHKSKLKPVPYYPSTTPSTHTLSFCPPTQPNARTIGHPKVMVNLGCGHTNSFPDLGQLPKPKVDPGPGGNIQITYPRDTQGANGWLVTITWVAEPVYGLLGNIIGWKWVPKYMTGEPPES